MSELALAQHPAMDSAVARRVAEWERVRPWVVEALERSPLNFQTIEYIEAAIEAGRVDFWAGKGCVIITRLDSCPAARIYTVCYVGGDIAEAIEGEDDLLRMAALLGCDKLLVEATPEYVEALQARGFKPAWVSLFKDVQSANSAPMGTA